MDAETFVDAIEADHETALSRLGSSKALYAATAGEMDTSAVLAAMAARARAAAETFGDWAAGTPGEDAARTFADAADRERSAAESIDDPDAVDVPEPGPLFDHLAGLEDTVERAAGLAAWSLVADATRAQAVGFFVGSADEATADTFRELRAGVDSTRTDALALLEAACAADGDWDRAVAAGAGTVEAAYDGYVDVLEGLGITVKPIC